jgi:hypothetical protein
MKSLTLLPPVLGRGEGLALLQTFCFSCLAYVAQKPEEPLMRRRLATLLPDCRVEAAGRTSALQLNSAALRWTCRDTQSEKKKKKDRN